MKKLLFLIALVFSLAISTITQATPVNVTQTYNIDYTMFNFQPFTFSLILHGFSDDNLGQPDQTDTIDLAAGPITSAEIALTHLNNQPNSWYLKSGNEMIGYLSPSDYSWITDQWSLSQPIITSMIETGLLDISFWNDSDVVQVLALDILTATVHGNTNVNPVPEPASIFLLGCGILSLAGLRRKHAPVKIRIDK